VLVGVQSACWLCGHFVGFFNDNNGIAGNSADAAAHVFRFPPYCLLPAARRLRSRADHRRIRANIPKPTDKASQAMLSGENPENRGSWSFRWQSNAADLKEGSVLRSQPGVLALGVTQRILMRACKGQRVVVALANDVLALGSRDSDSSKRAGHRCDCGRSDHQPTAAKGRFRLRRGDGGLALATWPCRS